MNIPKLTERRQSLLVFLAACAVYLPTLRFGFVLDDNALILENPLLKSWGSLPKLLATGYWEAAQGAGARVQEFRPLTALSFFLQYHLGGMTPWPYHLLNVLLHGAVSALVYKTLRRSASARFSLIAALAFAFLPIHVDAVANVAGRPELLALLGMLGAWWFLGNFVVSQRDRAAGLGCFAAALLCKENAALFPFAYAGADWFANGRRPWDAGREKVQAGLWSVLGVYMIVRALALGRVFHGGFPYFYDVSLGIKVLTLSHFWFLHYLIPTVFGAFQTADFSRPLIPLSRLWDPLGLFCAMCLIAGVDLAFSDFIQTRPGWAFWSLLAGLFLLPTSHLLFALDTIGAERFLYVPSLAWCAALGWAADRDIRARPVWPAVALLLAWYGARAVIRERIWRDPLAFYSTLVKENPNAGAPHYSLGVAQLEAGHPTEAEASFQEAVRLDPQDPAAYYDLGRLTFDRGDLEKAETWFKKALDKDPNEPDALVFLGLISDKEHKPDQAADWLRKALQARPWDPRAHYGLARTLLELGKKEDAEHELKEFLRLAPDDPNAPEARKLLGSSDKL